MSPISAVAIAGTALVTTSRTTLLLHLLPAPVLLGSALFPILLHGLIIWRAWRHWGTWRLPPCACRMLLHVLSAFALNLFPAFFLLGFTLFPFFVHRLTTG